jgi:hypothetical protein
MPIVEAPKPKPASLLKTRKKASVLYGHESVE